MRNEAETLQNCSQHYSVQKNIGVAHVFCCCGSLDLKMGKVKIGIYCYFIADILTKFFQKLSGPSPNILVWF